MTLWCVSPLVLGHGQLITNDVPAASVGLLAFYAIWRWTKAPSHCRALVCGGALGLAIVTKTSWLIGLGIWPLLLLGKYATQRADDQTCSWARQTASLLIGISVVIYTINLTYCFRGSFTLLRNYTFTSQILTGESPRATGNRFDGNLLGYLPLPLPSDFVLGVDRQKADFENYHRLNYLGGEFRENDGWWYYYLYGLCVKVPHGTQVAILSAVFMSLLLRRSNVSCLSTDMQVLIIPPITLLLLASFQVKINEHFRYVLPCLGFLFVFSGQLLLVRSNILRKLPVVFAAATLLSISQVYPHTLSYFNEFAGGTSKGCSHLLGSSFDWGQDLLRLIEWQERTNCTLSAYIHDHLYEPTDLGLKVRRGSSDLIAVSANQLHGPQSQVWMSATQDGAIREVTKIGYTVSVFQVMDATGWDLVRQVTGNGS